MAKRRYKKRTPKPQSEGLGDTIEKITKATGIQKAVEIFSEVTGIDCGCDERKEKLNKMFRYRKVECLTKDEHFTLSTLINRPVLRPEEQKQLNTIYNRVFNEKVTTTTCSSCLRDRVQRLTKVFNEYPA